MRAAGNGTEDPARMVDTAHAVVRLHAFPSDDWEFRDFVRAELARLIVATPDELQAAVRERYPLSTIRVRTDLATPAGETALWYAFRHAPGTPPPDMWWVTAPAQAILAADRTIIEASDALAAIVEAPPALLLGRRIEDFANPAHATVADDVAGLWAELERTGTLHGTMRFNWLDGTPREIEFHVEVDPANPRRFRAAVRER
jgi:PAS domain-containing protein